MPSDSQLWINAWNVKNKMKRSKNSRSRGWASFQAFTPPALHECWDPDCSLYDYEGGTLNLWAIFRALGEYVFERVWDPSSSLCIGLMVTMNWASSSDPHTHHNALSSSFFKISPKASGLALELKLLNPVPDFASLKDDYWRYLSTMKQSWMLWYKKLTNWLELHERRLIVMEIMQCKYYSVATGIHVCRRITHQSQTREQGRLHQQLNSWANHDYYPAFKRNGIVIHATTQLKFENMVPSKINKMPKKIVE